MRIAVGGFMHETNTFVAEPTTYEDFVRAGPWPTVTIGPEILTVFRDVNLAIADFMEAAEFQGHTMVPLAWGCAQPSGRVTDDAFERFSTLIIEGIRREKPDVIFLELHGAMVTQTFDDGESELLARVREVAPETPILLSLDLHGNISAETVRLADFISSYRTYPHTDWGLSGRRCAEWLDRVLAWGPRPARAFRQVPYLVPVSAGSTYVEPSKRLYAELERIEAESGVHLSLNMGFPPADIPDVGPSITAYGADQPSVDGAADRLLRAVMEAEPDYARFRPLNAREAVAEAMRIAASASRPVVLADTQDNPGAGAPSNTTGLIAELLAQGAERTVVGIVHDSRAAAAAHRAGIGGTVPSLGGGGEGPGQEALQGPWRVVALSDGRFVGTAPMLRTRETNMGPSALLRRDGVDVLVATIRQQPIHRETFTHIGVDLESCAILALKSSAHFRAGFQEIAERVIVCVAPGVNIADPARFPFTKIRPGVRLRPQAG
jgi:microcystin degradation protein MlrC